MEIPTARVMQKDTYRLGAGQTYPYRWYYGAISLFDRLELDGRVTEVIGVKALSDEYGNTKDKAIDIKYQLRPEGKYSPALSVGIMDPHGTRLYTGQYVVASKQIYPFDFTIGMGNGRFGKTPLGTRGNDVFNAEIFSDTKQWLKDSQIFWGIQFSPSDKYSFMVEYNPIRYDKQTGDPAQAEYFTRPVPLKYNFGFRWRPLKWTEIDLTYQRGSEFGLNLSVLFDIGQPLIPIYDKPYKEKPAIAVRAPSERIAAALKEQGFSDIGVDQEKDTMIITAQNDKYFYSMRAVGVILKTVKPILPPDIEHVRITLTDIGIPKFQVVTTRADITDLYEDRMTPGEFFYISKINTDARGAEIPTRDKKFFDPGIKPSFQTLLNDPSGFFKYRLGLEGWISYHPWKGTSLIAGVEGYPVNNISSSNIPPSEAVRSDIFEYKGHNASLGRLMVDQINKKNNVYTRFAAGLLEIEYAGLDGEIAMPLRNGRFLVGLQASIVKKRDPGSPFALRKYNAKNHYDVEFLNTRLNIPEKDMALDLKTGRFLGTDFGTRVTLIKYVKSVTLYAWYSFTNTSVFKDKSNRGYHDSGIGVSIPLRLFEGTDTKTAYSYGLSPWTRDVAQDLNRYQELFDFIGRDTKVFLREDQRMVE
ncbi:MAG: hypothetical protein A4E57_01822 [Syntrophorhabdaceae bacterium PtaU1.Bin034]|nr:MAG: hypothetical protein A4E57_01822 [Syntrophorhabdaceae bacterium PtaU1.Bin034]